MANRQRRRAGGWLLLLRILYTCEAFRTVSTRRTTATTDLSVSVSSTGDFFEQQRRPPKKYQRKRGIPATELRLKQVKKQRQQQYENIMKKESSIWAFESLFPNPVHDEESILKDLYRQPDGRDGNLRSKSQITQRRKEKSVAPKQTSWNSYLSNQFNKLFTNTASDVPSSLNATTSSQEVDKELTRMVEDRMYGYRRVFGKAVFDTSVVGGAASAVQFREGVRLSNPLRINADVLTYYAKKDLQHGKIEEAAEMYEICANLDPCDGRSYLGLSNCARRRRDFALARKYLQLGISRSVSVDSETELPDRGANPYLLQALGCLEEKMGKLSEAEKLFEAAADSRPSHAAAWVSLAQIRTRKLGYPVKAGRVCFERAESELKKANKSPSSHVYTAWGNLERRKGNNAQKARRLFRKAIDVDPRCSAAWLQLGVLEADTENWDEAVKCFETVLKFDKRNSRVLQAYAIAETKRPGGESRFAIDLFERALKAKPRDAGVLQAFALYVAELGDMEAARRLLERGTKVNKRHSAVWQAWGVMESRFGDPTQARNIFQQGIWACGQATGSQSGGYHCARLWQAWGVLEAKVGDHAAARRCFSRALDADARNVPAFTAWALMEEETGNIEDARIVFERALKQFSIGSEEKISLWRSFELMEKRLGNTDASNMVYQRSMRDVMTIPFDGEEDSCPPKETADANSMVQASPKKNQKSKNEFEVFHFESTGGEVWMNDKDIEAKMPRKFKQKQRP